jgi:hypothetical protein
MKDGMRMLVSVFAGLVFLLMGGCVTQQAGSQYVDIGSGETLVRYEFPLPKLMLLIDEKNLGTIATAEIEAMGVDMIKKRKGQIADQDMVRANIKKDQQLLKAAGDNRGAAALGLQYGADVIIVGEAVAKPSARRIAESNLRTYEAVVTLRAIRTDNSETMASASETASIVALEDVSGSSKALKAAASKAFDTFLDAVGREWQKAGVSPSGKGFSPVSLTAGGVDQVWKLKAVREKLRGFDFLKNVSQKNYAMGVANFDLESSIPAEEVAEKIVLSPPDGLKLQIIEVSKGRINIRAVATAQ